jgi:integrating conjugative element protein (TIGR03756 family)
MNQAAQSMGNSVGGANGQDYSNMDSSSALSSMNSMICPGGSGLCTINFDSDLDNLFWRGVIPLEQLYPGTWIPGIGEVGNGLINTWGGTYPRIGMLTQTDPVKASAVIAARVANIIEQAGQPHIYKKLSGQGSKVYFQVAQDPRWQMLYPVPSNGCITFGSNDSLTLTSFGDGKTSGNNGYVWNLWHRYECCQIEGAFLFAVP